MKISGKLKNTLFDLQKIFHDQIPSNDKDISSKKKTEKMSKCCGLKKCRTSVSKTPKYRFVHWHYVVHICESTILTPKNSLF